MKGQKTWKIIDKAERCELLLYGSIASESWFDDDVTPKMFADDLKACGGKPLDLRINSSGGDVFAAQAMYTLLKAYSGDVTVHIDGLAASAATVVACAGDTVIMPSNALYMIHNPSVMLFGGYQSDKLSLLAAQLDTVRDTIVNVYANRCNIKRDDLESMMAAETWLTAAEAMNYGFVDSVDTPAEQINNYVDFSCFADKDKAKKALGGMKVDNKDLIGKIKGLLGIGQQKPSGMQSETAVDDTARLVALDKLADGSESVAELIALAKTKGLTADDIATQVDNVKALNMIKNMIADSTDSGAEGVKPDTGKTIDDAINEVVALANQMRGAE